MAESDDTPPGLILPNGDINWNCPCLGGMAVGPCGVEFRDAFSCFHYSTEEPKGKECLEKFAKMQECMKEYPELFEEKKRGDPEESEEAASDNGDKAGENKDSTTESKEEVKADSDKKESEEKKESETQAEPKSRS